MFKEKKYSIIRNAISKDLAIFLNNYISMKKQVYDTCIKEKYISPFEKMFGWYESKNEQVENTYCCYSDIAMETMLLKCQPKMEETTKLKLYPSYSYARVYKKNDELKRHKDRFSCEISATLNLGGDEWPIYISSNKEDGVFKDGKYIPSKTKGIKVDLHPGDMLIYRGSELEHWREPFKGEECMQVFLHYNDCKTPDSEKNMFDKRPHLGLPPWFKNKVKY